MLNIKFGQILLLSISFCLVSFLFHSCHEELPVSLRGNIKHAITGEPMEEMELLIENIRCNGFQPAICSHFQEKVRSDNSGSFYHDLFMECESEIYIRPHSNAVDYLRKKYVFTEITGGDTSISCNNRMVISPNNNYYFEIEVIPVLYIDIYGNDDPELQLQSLYFGEEEIHLIQDSHFQKRLKIDLTQFEGEIILVADYGLEENKEIAIPFNYNMSDHITYELSY